MGAKLFVQVPKIGQATISTGDTALVNPSTGQVTVITGAGSIGTQVDRVVIEAAGTTTRGMVRLFIFDNSATYNLYKEIEVPAQTPASTNETWRYVVENEDSSPLFTLPPSYQVVATTQNSETFTLNAFGGDL